MFVPSLPLMQSEVCGFGDHAVEQVAELFVTMMTLGEMIGPIFGGWLVGHIGFVRATCVLAFTCAPLLVLAIVTYDSSVVKSRRRAKAQQNSVQADNLEAEEYAYICGPQCGPRCAPAVMPSDGEASFAWRRIPFAIDAKRFASDPQSAPSSIFRRHYVPKAAESGSKGYMTAPSESFRRAYVPPVGQKGAR